MPILRLLVHRRRPAARRRGGCATLPYLAQPHEPVAYETGVRRELVVHAHELDVSVDLATGAVAGVEPDTPAIPYGTVVREHPAGGPDSTDCWSSGD